MDVFITEFAGYGPVALMVAFVVFLMRGQLLELFRGSNSETVRLILALEKVTEALDRQSSHMAKQTENFTHNNQMFQAITQEAAQMVQVLHDSRQALLDIKDEIIRNSVGK